MKQYKFILTPEDELENRLDDFLYFSNEETHENEFMEIDCHEVALIKEWRNKSKKYDLINEIINIGGKYEDKNI